MPGGCRKGCFNDHGFIMRDPTNANDMNATDGATGPVSPTSGNVQLQSEPGLN